MGNYFDMHDSNVKMGQFLEMKEEEQVARNVEMGERKPGSFCMDWIQTKSVYYVVLCLPISSTKCKAIFQLFVLKSSNRSISR